MNTQRTFRLHLGLLILSFVGFVAVTQSGWANVGNMTQVRLAMDTYEVDFGRSDLPPLPPDFFFVGSASFEGEVELCDGADDDCNGLDPDEFPDLGRLSFIEGATPQTFFYDDNTSFGFHSASPFAVVGPAGDVFYDIILEMDFDPAGSGQTTLSPGQPGSNFIVDSFFDVAYQFEFVPVGGIPGDPGNPTTSAVATLRLDAPTGTVPVDLRVGADGTTEALLLGYDGSQFAPMNFVSDGGGFELIFTGVPEPSTFVLALCGAALWSLRTRKHRV